MDSKDMRGAAAGGDEAGMTANAEVIGVDVGPPVTFLVEEGVNAGAFPDQVGGDDVDLNSHGGKEAELDGSVLVGGVASVDYRMDDTVILPRDHMDFDVEEAMKDVLAGVAEDSEEELGSKVT